MSEAEFLQLPLKFSSVLLYRKAVLLFFFFFPKEIIITISVAIITIETPGLGNKKSTPTQIIDDINYETSSAYHKRTPSRIV